MVPGVLYGHGEATAHLAVKGHDLRQALAAGAKVFSLQMPRGLQQVLVKEVQYDAYGQEIVHVDFARIAMDEAISVQVPVELHGTLAEAGVVNQLMHSIEVRCRADRIPEKVRVEISGRHPGDVIRLGDLSLPEGVSAVAAGETVVVAIAAPTEVEEVVAAPAPEAAEPEVITARREEKEEEAAAESEEKAKPSEKSEKK
jgi:large subunit ribosomal protein L25